ncbi:MAG: hypothetical protein R3E01_26570 [Pirellulaceae bacterium]|nr:hypothetical protein [Planctomycetales bacterium]
MMNDHLRRFARWLPVTVVAMLIAVSSANEHAVADDPPVVTNRVSDRQPSADDPQAAAEKDFAERLTNSILVGRFTIDGSGDLSTGKEERYEIGRVQKYDGDRWTFNARIKYGDHDVTVPLLLKVKWAETTPVLTLDDLTIPGLGTFSARVLFHGDRYVGTWQHGDVGGHMFGNIRSKDAEQSDN